MLLLKRSQIAEQLTADADRLARIETRLRIIERENVMSQSSEVQFIEKSLPSVLLAQLTAEVTSVEEIGDVVGPMFGRLMPALGEAGVPVETAAMAWYDPRDESVGLGVEVPITESSRQGAQSVEGVQVDTLPDAERALTVVHLGAMDTIAQTWQTLQREVESRGLQPAGRCREVYFESPQDNPDAWVTELQQPVT